MTLDYVHLDVFTDQLFGGNQLAVYLNPPPGLRADTMQAIAREMAYSETTFVLPAEDPATDLRVRIFTPAEELPMAGHPTIGTAFALAHARRLLPECGRTVFGEGVGPIPVDLEWNGAALRFAWMTQPRPRFGPELADLEGLAAALGVRRREIGPDGLPVQEVDCGGPFLMVPLASRTAVDGADAEARALTALYRAAGWASIPVYLFTTERGADDADAYARMFGPTIGIIEDPATGSACGPLGGYLVRHGLVQLPHARPLVTLQGVRMGRPSRLYVEPQLEAGDVVAVRVGGTAVVAGTGQLFL